MRSSDPQLRLRHNTVISLIVGFGGGAASVVVGAAVDETLAGVAGAILLGFLALAVELRGTVFDMARFFGDAIELRRAVDRDPFLRGSINDVVTAYLEVAERAVDSGFAVRAQDTLDRALRELRFLAGGDMRVHHAEGMTELMARLAQRDLRRLLAVSKGPVWAQQAGKNYNELNIKRARQGVEIVRVFLEDDVHDIPEETKRVMQAQADAGIEVYVAGRDQVHDKFHKGVAIFDETLFMSLDKLEELPRGSEQVRGAPEQPEWRIELSTDRSRVRGARATFDAVKNSGKPWRRSRWRTPIRWFRRRRHSLLRFVNLR